MSVFCADIGVFSCRLVLKKVQVVLMHCPPFLLQAPRNHIPQIVATQSKCMVGE